MIDIWRLLVFLVRLSRGIRLARVWVLLIAVAGLISGFANTGMIVIINNTLSGDSIEPAHLGWAFIGLCAALPVFRFLSQAILIKLTNRTIYVLRLQLCRRILAAPLRHLETLGEPRLMAALNNDVNQLTGGLVNIPLLFMHSAIVIGCLVYMGWLSMSILAYLLVFMFVGILMYQIPLTRAMRHLVEARGVADSLFNDFRALTQGTKELKMHLGRRDGFLAEVESNSSDFHRANIKGNTIFAAASSWAQALFFVFVGFLLFIVTNYQGIDKSILIGYTLTVFHLMTPLEAMLNMLPALSNASASMKNVEKLNFQLAEKVTESESNSQLTGKSTWERLDLVDVCHTYYQESADESFLLGPINLTFPAGQVAFIVGGNGSGKTSLAKMILGLYPPESGEVRLDGKAISDDNRDSYRQKFSVVFSDFFLFEKLLGVSRNEVDEKARSYLEQLHLDRKVSVENGKLSTIDLSQGQRKRLALLTAYLEDRDIYLFDEWAADQDPQFKRIFYESILSSLKGRGKTVLVISHDDSYYHLADRVIKMNYGHIVFDGTYDAYLRWASEAPRSTPATKT